MTEAARSLMMVPVGNKPSIPSMPSLQKQESYELSGNSSTNCTGPGRMAEIFPDIHYKMSKKIAQLTKVIYHLNSKNEDHQMDMEALNANHQNEIEQILRDASTKISKFREQLETKKIELNAEAKFNNFMVKYNTEKQQAQEEFKRLREEARRRADEAKELHSREVGQLKSEVCTAKRRYEEKLKELGDATLKLKDAYEMKKEQMHAEAAEKKARHEKEVEDLVQTSNDKYKAMMIEQLAAQDALRHEMSKRLEETRREEGDTWRREVEELNAKLRAEKEEALAAQNRDHNSTLKGLRESQEKSICEWSTKVERLLKEAEKLQKDKAHLNGKLTELEKVVSETRRSLGDARIECASVKEDLDAATAREADLRVILGERDKELKDCRQMLQDLQQSLERDRLQIAEKITSNQDLENRLNDALVMCEQLKGTTAVKLSHKDEILVHKETEIQQLRALLTDASKDSELRVADLQHQADTTRRQHEAQIIRLLDEVKSLKEDAQASDIRHNFEQSSLTKKAEGLEETVRSLKVSLEACKAQLVQERKDSEDSASTRDAAWAQEVTKYTTCIRDLEQQMEQLRKESAGMLRVQQGLLEQRVAEHKEALQAGRDRHESVTRELVSRLEREQEAGSASVTDLRLELERSTDEVNRLRLALEGEKTSQGVQGVKVQQLEDYVASLRKEMAIAVQAEQARSLEQAKAVRKEQSQRLDLQRQVDERAMQCLRQELEDRMSSLSAAHQEEVERLRSLLQSEAARARDSDELLKASRQSADHAEESRKAEYEEEMKELADKYAAEIASLRKQHEANTSATTEHLKQLQAEELGRLHADHLAATQRLQSAIEDLELKHVQRIRDLEHELSMKAARGIRSQEERLVAEATRARQRLIQSHDAQMGTLRAEVEGERKSLTQERARCANLSRALAEKKEELREKSREMRKNVDGLKLDAEQNERTLRSKHEQELEQRDQLHTQAMQRHRDEYTAGRRKLEKSIHALQKQLQNADVRYEQRESRPEDLQKIAQLNEAVGHAEVAKKRAVEEMMYFKLELVNREETYNKIFARSPNVGLMQPLKPQKQPLPIGGNGVPLEHRKRSLTLPVMVPKTMVGDEMSSQGSLY